MTFAVDARNTMLDALLTGTKYISLHDGFPYDDGTDELTGGSYARQACTFSAASGGAKRNNVAVLFPGLPECDILAFGIWDAVSGGNFICSGLIDGDRVGAFTVKESTDVFTSVFHGLSDGDIIFFSEEPFTDSTFPGDIFDDEPYYVRDSDDDGFKVSETEGGAAYDVEDDGAGMYMSARIQHFNVGRTARFIVNGITVRLMP